MVARGQLSGRGAHSAQLECHFRQLATEFSGFAVANQDSRAYGALRAARQITRHLRECVDLSRELGKLTINSEFKDDMDKVFNFEHKTLNLVGAMVTLCYSDNLERDLDVFVNLAIKHCVGNDLVKWRLETDSGPRELNGALLKRLFRAICPQVSFYLIIMLSIL